VQEKFKEIFPSAQCRKDLAGCAATASAFRFGTTNWREKELRAGDSKSTLAG
jgi:hypothetical protein